MFKKWMALFLLLTFTAQTFSAPFLWLDYYGNTSAYAKNCVNKARPQLHCNGKCQLMKKMREEEKKEQQQSERKGEPKMPLLSSKSFFYSINHFVVLHPTPTETGTCDLVVDRSYAFFHPPQL